MNTCRLRPKEKYIVEVFVKAVIMEIIPGQDNNENIKITMNMSKSKS